MLRSVGFFGALRAGVPQGVALALGQTEGYEI